jgi:hypothetical protein
VLREFDAEAGAFRPEAVARAQAAKATYLDAVKDWAINGRNSRFAFDPDQARNHVRKVSGDVMLAHAQFQLGQYLARQGRTAEAEALFAQCRDLHPDSWNIFRQTAEKLETGIAGGEGFWNKVKALGDKPYYEDIDMEGLK